MNIKSVYRHLKILSKIKEFTTLTDNLIEEVRLNETEVKDLSYKDYVFRIKHILLEWCYYNNIEIKYDKLNLINFVIPTFGIMSLDLVKLDAWLYNELLDEFGNKIHDMSGVDKLKSYTDNNKVIMRWLK